MKQKTYRLGLEEAKEIIIQRLMNSDSTLPLSNIFIEIFDALEKKIDLIDKTA